MVREREKRVGQRSSRRRQLARDDGQRQSTRDSRETSRMRWGLEQWGKMSRHSSSVVEFSLETHAGVSLQLHIGTMLHNSPSALELTQAYCSFVIFFFSHSLGCISCSGKEMCDAPVGTTSWSPAAKILKWFEEVDVFGVGAKGVTSYIYIYMCVCVCVCVF